MNDPERRRSLVTDDRRVLDWLVERALATRSGDAPRAAGRGEFTDVVQGASAQGARAA